MERVVAISFGLGVVGVGAYVIRTFLIEIESVKKELTKLNDRCRAFELLSELRLEVFNEWKMQPIERLRLVECPRSENPQLVEDDAPQTVENPQIVDDTSEQATTKVVSKESQLKIIEQRISDIDALNELEPLLFWSLDDVCSALAEKEYLMVVGRRNGTVYDVPSNPLFRKLVISIVEDENKTFLVDEFLRFV